TFHGAPATSRGQRLVAGLSATRDCRLPSHIARRERTACIARAVGHALLWLHPTGRGRPAWRTLDSNRLIGRLPAWRYHRTTRQQFRIPAETSQRRRCRNPAAA